MINGPKLKGILSLLGQRPAQDFTHYFGAPRPAFQNSLAAIGGSALLILILARYVLILRARVLGDSVSGFPALYIGVTAFLYLAGFTLIAFCAAKFFQKDENFYAWTALRHWLVFLSLIPLTLIMVLTGLGLLPVMLANGLIFTAYMGWLVMDIRLAYKFGDLGFIGSIFTGCLIHTLGLFIILTAVLQRLSA